MMKTNKYSSIMSNRLTLMNDEMPLILSGKVARERATRRIVKKISAQASLHQKRDLEPKHHVSESKSTSLSSSKSHAVTVKNHNFTQIVRSKSRTFYHTFMPLDQADPTVIARDNMKDRAFVTIKRVKRADRDPVYRISNFTSDHLVNIKDMFLKDDDEIVIVYEQMNVSLRHIVAVIEGSLQVFEITTICKEISDCIEVIWWLLTRSWQLIDDLFYIHEKLSLYHDTLSCSSVLLNQNGKIKIGKFHSIRDRAKRLIIYQLT